MDFIFTLVYLFHPTKKVRNNRLYSVFGVRSRSEIQKKLELTLCENPCLPTGEVDRYKSVRICVKITELLIINAFIFLLPIRFLIKSVFFIVFFLCCFFIASGVKYYVRTGIRTAKSIGQIDHLLHRINELIRL